MFVFVLCEKRARRVKKQGVAPQIVWNVKKCTSGAHNNKNDE